MIKDLGQNISYDSINQTIYKDSDVVHLSNLETKLFHFLFENLNEYVSFEEIHDKVWKGRNMSRFTLRNKIKYLRDKTFRGLIINKSNIGYMMRVE